jgi:uncharacterized phiE125 gp8 family phage protein
MELMETSTVAPEDLPVPELRAHMRLGVGFANEAEIDPDLRRYLAAAIARIEAHTGKALLQRTYRLVLPAWRVVDAQNIPVAPVVSIEAFRMRNRIGSATTVATGRYRLVGDRHSPKLVAMGAGLPSIPAGGNAEIDFTAGFGIGWDAVPDDLAQAVFLLAAHYFEARTGASVPMPAVVEALIRRWTPVRLTAGGHR